MARQAGAAPLGIRDLQRALIRMRRLTGDGEQYEVVNVLRGIAYAQHKTDGRDFRPSVSPASRCEAQT